MPLAADLLTPKQKALLRRFDDAEEEGLPLSELSSEDRLDMWELVKLGFVDPPPQ